MVATNNQGGGFGLRADDADEKTSGNANTWAKKREVRKTNALPNSTRPQVYVSGEIEWVAGCSMSLSQVYCSY